MTTERIVDNCLKKLFRAVGLTYPDKEFTKDPQWFTKRTWTTTQEADFQDWMKAYLRKHRPSWSARTINSEVFWFMLNYSWKYAP